MGEEKRCIVIRYFADFGLCTLFIFIFWGITVLISGSRGLSVLKKGGLFPLNQKKERDELGKNPCQGKVDLESEHFFWKENNILCVWLQKWNSTAGETEKKFAGQLLEIYQSVVKLEEKNKNKNFIFKFLFIGIMIVALVGFIVFCFFALRAGNLLSFQVIGNSVVLVVIFLTLWIVVKWLDVKKYQETWVRHYQHRYMLQREMYRYYYGMDEYAVSNQTSQETVNQAFMRRFIEIEDANTEKFVGNMENKEVDMGDILKRRSS